MISEFSFEIQVSRDLIARYGTTCTQHNRDVALARKYAGILSVRYLRGKKLLLMLHTV